MEEKKRRWWRNAIINMAFIASWYVVHMPSDKHQKVLRAFGFVFLGEIQS